ncbi:MAG: iron ABC transporter permease [Bacteroidetes bacterium]|nr:iron ABC transporter permease [Bacteroidota bacterium]
MENDRSIGQRAGITSPAVITAYRVVTVSVVFALSTLACILLSLHIGSYPITLTDMLALFSSVELDTTDPMHAVFFEIRIPRVITALLVGGGLAAAGVVFQVLLRNVLADPYILGVSSGAAVGALIAIALGLVSISVILQPALAFFTALLVVAVVYRLGLRGALESNTLILSGVMIGAFLSAIILGMVSTMDRPVRNALFWLVGYLGGTTSGEVAILLPGVVLLFLFLYLLSGRMNILALGVQSAMHLGVDVKRLQALLYILASLLTALVVSFSGVIGFIGLLVPHVARRLFGPDHRLLLPVSFFLGANFLIISDLIARSIITPNELPVGAVTAALGAPLFIYILRRKTTRYT